jgi:hypothetical protein
MLKIVPSEKLIKRSTFTPAPAHLPSALLVRILSRMISLGPLNTKTRCR